MRLRALGVAVVLGVVGVVVPLASVVAADTAADERPCRNTTIAGDVEEQRLTRTLGSNPVPVPARIVDSAGYRELIGDFERSLCRTHSLDHAKIVIDRHGEKLWRTTVSRARAGQGDDRPLYWARVNMTLALRQWRPRFGLSDTARAALRRDFERASRGITTSSFTPAPGTRTVFVSGFDPFTLDSEIRRGNPSGAAVLRLDGARFTLDGQRYEIQTVVFPVRYGDFDEGIVEGAFRPHLVDGRQQADWITTISQGRPDAFDLEIHNGRRRSISSIGDNLNVWGGGSPTAPVVAPGIGPGPEFVPTSLPTAAMLAATGKPYLVRENPSVTEIPAGQTQPVTRPDGPTPGSIAVSGSGGGYLSNEVAYRTSLLRVTLGANIPGGHVHTPVLTFDPANTTEITDPSFERQRTGIAAQTELILRAGLGSALGSARP